MRVANICISLTLFAFGGWYLWLTLGLPKRTLPNTPGPSFMPFVLVFFLFLLAGVLILQQFRGGESDEEEASSGKAVSREKLIFATKFFLMLAVIGGYIGLIEEVGYLLSTPVFLFLIMCLLGERTWWRAVFVALAISLGLYVIFHHGFHILLPEARFLD
ncbi:MAG: tripartite tricarboxylate transporter TctB family protein [Nitrospinota bacterium]